MLEWVVTCKMNGLERVYDITADRYYGAKIKAVSQFLVENRIPGRPWEYLSGKRGLIEVSVQSKNDSRKEPRRTYELDYFLEQAVRLKEQVRDSKLSDATKKDAVRLLRNLRAVLNGETTRQKAGSTLQG